MKRGRACLWLTLFVLSPGFGPVAAQASDAEAELRALQGRLAEFEATLAQRQRVGSEARPEDPRQAASALSAFLEQVDVSGFVAPGLVYQRYSYSDSNSSLDQSGKSTTFQLDQAWVEIEKAPSEESRTGFNLAFEMGQFASQAGSSNTPGLYSAYLSYLVPLGEGLRIDAGILPTALGAEHEQQNLNWNISRGLVWDLQPVTSTGVTARYALSDALSLMLGAINEPIASARSAAFKQKAVTGQLAYQRDTWGVKLGVNYGRSSERVLATADPNLVSVMPAQYRSGLYDVVFSWNPFENLGFWANWDYHFGEQPEGTHVAGINAVALAVRLGATETVGFAFRYEWIGIDNPTQDRIQSFTVTIDHEITDSLTGKVEYRYEKIAEKGYLEYKGNAIYTQLLYEF